MLEFMKRLLAPAVDGAESHERHCLCCGECCRSFGGHLHAYDHDLARWQREGRDDLLSRVNHLGWIWVDPVSKELEESCPFLARINEEQSICRIQDTKPDICRAYPTLDRGNRCLRGVFLDH